MNIVSNALGPAETNYYLIWQEGQSKALLVDAPHGTWDQVQKTLAERGLILGALLITHGHWDHMADASIIKEESGVDVYAHEGDRRWYDDPSDMNTLLPEELHIAGVNVDHWLKDGENMDLFSLDFEVRHVPGHSPGNILFYFDKEGIAFVGDAIFANSMGRTDLPYSNHEQLLSSIRSKIFTLPKDTTLYSGHGPKTTVGVEEATNPFLN